MKLFATSVLMSVLIFLVSSCKDDSYNVNQEFTLKFGKTAIINRPGDPVIIQFEKLVQESRCRPGNECFWEGDVSIRLKVNKGAQYTLGFNSDSPSDVTHDNLKITLLDVTYDKEKNYGKEKHYSIKLKTE